MATYVNDLRLKEIATGDESGTWGASTNTNLELIAEAFSYGTEASFGSDADATTTIADGATDPARSLYFKVTSGVSLTATRTLTLAPNDVSKVWIIENATSGSQSINISQGSGSNVTIGNGDVKIVYSDGGGASANVVDAFTDLSVTDKFKIEGSTPTLTIGDGGEEDTKLVFDGNAKDFYVGLDDSADKLVIGEGSTVGTNSIVTLTDDSVTIGDGAEVDTKIVFDGNAQDFYIGLDDSADDLVIGVGSTVGTTPAITINENQNVAVSSLDITGNSEVLTIAASTGTSQLYQKYSSDGGNHYIGVASSTGAGLLSNAGAYSLNIQTESARNIALGTNNTLAMLIDSSQNVGIGEISPDTLLHLTKPSENADVDFIKMQMSGWAGSSGQVKNIAWSDGTNVAAIGAEFTTNKVNMHFHSFYNGGYKTETTKLLSILGDGGITFNGDTAAANALDDYEEGTWTPVLTGSASGGSYTVSTQAGIYTKIGGMVNVQFLIIITGVSSQPTGNVNVTGLPFAFSRTGAQSYMPMGVIGYNDVFSVEINKAYATGSQLTLIPNGITQSNSNWSGVTLSTGYFSGNIWYPA